MGIFGADGSREDYLVLDARVASLDARVKALEATVARLHTMLAAASVSVSDQVPLPQATAAAEVAWESEARALKAQGNLIGAIKIVREATRCGLKEAKDYVSQL